jgi:hypothetical protein
VERLGYVRDRQQVRYEAEVWDIQKSCNANVKVFNRNNAMLRKKNTCSTCKRKFERLLTPERVT